jgi:DNA-binding SARP family transcriptional activator/TolB-like protein
VRTSIAPSPALATPLQQAVDPPPAAPLRLTLLGRMDARDAAGRAVLPRARKARAVLAILALSAPEPVPRDRLIELLWSGRSRDQAHASLRQCVHELQTLLPPLDRDLFRVDRRYLSLRVEAVSLDLAARAPAVRPAPLLEDLRTLDPAFETWLLEARRRLDRIAAAEAEMVLNGLMQSGPGSPPDAVAILAAAEHLLAIDRTHEGAWRAIMATRAARGERAAAIDAYARCAAAIAEVADVAPAAETQALLAAIRSDAAATGRLRAAAPPFARPAPPPWGHGARLGVMPFRSLDSPGEAPLALGLAEEITTALSRFRWIFIIASTSLAAIANEPIDSTRWQELHLDFLLGGTVLRDRDRARVTVQLLDLRAGGEVAWTGRFDRDAADMLNLLDEIASETVARVDPELLAREGRHSAARPTNNVTAYDLVLRAIPAIYRLEPVSFRAAGNLLADAVALDPDYAAAHAWWACWHLFQVGQGWADDAVAAMARAGELAGRAIALDPSDARGLTIAGHVRAFLHYRIEEALALHERALSLNPNLPLAWALSGIAHTYAGLHEEAIRRIHRASHLSPLDPHTFFFDMALMMPHLLRGDFETVVELGHRALELNPALTSTYKGMVAALGHLGRTDEASAMADRLLRLDPAFRIGETVARTPLVRAEDRVLYAEGLRRAGMPE